MNKDKSTHTPVMRQFLEIKENYQDAFLFFRLGDFYELFFEDALLAAKELEITLTARGRSEGQEKIPMCGVPHHAADSYIDKLISKGYKVAICEQIDDPKTTKGMVRRAVTHVLTPGTVTRGSAINEKENNFLVSIEKSGIEYGLCYADLSTGEMYALKVDEVELISKLITLDVKELVVDENFDQTPLLPLKEMRQMIISFENNVSVGVVYEILAKRLLDQNLYHAFGRLINYIEKTQNSALVLLQEVKLAYVDDFMKLDYNSRANLELTQTTRKKTKHGSLLWLLDETQTAMGGRLLKRWIEMPLNNLDEINKRHHHVSLFHQNFMQLENFRRAIGPIYDFQRLIGRVASNTANPKDLLQLANSIDQLPEVANILSLISPEMFDEYGLYEISELSKIVNRAIMDTAGIGIKEGQIINDGYNEQLDKYRHVMKNGKNWILELELQEKERTGIKNLKIKYNKVFGYHIEVTTSNLHLITDDLGYIRKQTLSNCERFITTELKEKEDIILNASDRAVELEYQLFISIREELKQFVTKVQENAAVLAYYDVISCFAHIASENHYIKPQMVLDGNIKIIDGRHPVVEKVLAAGTYVANDCIMDENSTIHLITGPNMSGKSTYMRQIALIAIIAQIGSFVPASEATLPIFDQIFTRIGAGDDLTSGHSTFMVEMLETNYALKKATEKSLILLDEIGRGTATFDGMALAQGIIEFIHDRIGAKTLFATHYHELTDLENSLSKLSNLHVRAKEYNGELIFMHKVSLGASDKSYGIHVARIAKMPEDVTSRAKELLKQFETNGTRLQNIVVKNEEAETTNKSDELIKVAMDKIINRLKKMNVNELSPIEALLALADLKNEIEIVN